MLAEYDVNGPRISSFFGDEIIMGSYIARLSPIFFALFFYLYSDKNKKKGFLFYYSLIIFFLIEPIIFITGERTSFFLYNLSLALIFFLTNEFKKYKIILAAGTIFLFCSALYLKPEIGNRIINYSINQMKNIDGEKHLFTSMHTGHYKIAINMFFDNKLIGIGPKNFRKQCSYQKYHELAYADNSKEKVTACSSHPHNVYFQLLAETGIFSFILIFYIFFYFCYKILRIFFSLNIYKKELANFQICIISAFIVNLWPLAPSGNFFNNYLNIIYFFPIGFYLWSANDELSTKI